MLYCYTTVNVCPPALGGGYIALLLNIFHRGPMGSYGRQSIELQLLVLQSRLYLYQHLFGKFAAGLTLFTINFTILYYQFLQEL